MARQTFTMTIKGDKELKEKIKRMGSGVNDALESAAVAGVQPIKDRANNLAPDPHIDFEVIKKTRTRAENY